MASLGFITRRFIHGLDDYFAAGHNVPWWLAAISHHVSGYSAFAFVGYASVAYTVGPEHLDAVRARLLPRHDRRRLRLGPALVAAEGHHALQSLEKRFNRTVHQVIAWSGIGVKFIDEGMKLYSLGIIVAACTGLPLNGTIIGCCVVTVLYL